MLRKLCYKIWAQLCIILIKPGLIYGSKYLSLTNTPFADFTDVTLSIEDNNSIPTDESSVMMPTRKSEGIDALSQVISKLYIQ